VSASRTTALEAFALMDAERVSALGICDDEYKIVANVSISDLRGITPTNIHRLSLNIDEFLRQQRGSFSFGRAMSDNPGLDEMNDVVCCGIHATIGDVVSSMVSARLHHIYVVSGDGHPLSLVTPSDVLRLLSEELIEG
jgi:CBS-domain-containing membrane protein